MVSLQKSRKLLLLAFAILSIIAIGCFAGDSPNGLFAVFMLAIEVSAGAIFALANEDIETGYLTLEVVVCIITLFIGIPSYAKYEPKGVFAAFFILVAVGTSITVFKPARQLGPALPNHAPSPTPQRQEPLPRSLLLVAFAILSVIGIGCFVGGEPTGVFVAFVFAIAVTVGVIFTVFTFKSINLVVLEVVTVVITLIIGIPCFAKNKPGGVFAAFFILAVISISTTVYKPSPRAPLAVTLNTTTSPTLQSPTLRTLSDITSQFSGTSTISSLQLSRRACLMCRERPKKGNFDFCSHSCKDNAILTTPLLIEVPQGHATYTTVENKFRSAWKHPQKKPCPQVTKVYKVMEDSRSRAQYKAYLGQHGTERFCYHGTKCECGLGLGLQSGNLYPCMSSTCALCCVLRSSFRVSMARPSGAFGSGIYTSTASNKAANYTNGLLLVAKVVLGRIYRVQDFAEVNGCPDNFNSVVFDRLNGQLNETVVYEDAAIRPVYLIRLS